MIITGTVTRKSIAGGFWAIIGDDGQQWRPTNLPKSLQKDGKIVTVNARLAEEDMSIFMWGTAIEII
jgi:hypothetical protein